MIKEKRPLKKGSKAPGFNLKVTPDQTISLADFSGRPVVLIFYPADFSPVCSSEIVLFDELMPEFDKFGAQVLGISVDNVWSHLAFAREAGTHIPLLADFHPKGEVSRAYNAYREEDGESERALYVIDGDGKVAWGFISPVGVSPGVDGVLQALEELSGGKLAVA